MLPISREVIETLCKQVERDNWGYYERNSKVICEENPMLYAMMAKSCEVMEERYGIDCANDHFSGLCAVYLCIRGQIEANALND